MDGWMDGWMDVGTEEKILLFLIMEVISKLVGLRPSALGPLSKVTTDNAATLLLLV